MVIKNTNFLLSQMICLSKKILLLNLNSAQDGTYSVEVDLWNASKDQPSMAADANR